MYAGSYSSIRKVDFRNLKPGGSYGHFKAHEVGVYSSADLDAIYYLSKLPPSLENSAVVLYSWFSAGGSSSQGGIADVFTLTNGRLQFVQRIGWDTHFDAGQPTDSFDPSTNTLVIRSAHYIPGDAHCCVSAMDVVTFRWDGTRFVKSGSQTELSEYGRREGTILPTILPR